MVSGAETNNEEWERGRNEGKILVVTMSTIKHKVYILTGEDN